MEVLLVLEEQQQLVALVVQVEEDQFLGNHYQHGLVEQEIHLLCLHHKVIQVEVQQVQEFRTMVQVEVEEVLQMLEEMLVQELQEQEVTEQLRVYQVLL